MTTTKPLVVYHLWPCPGWKPVHRKLWNLLDDSGLYDAAEVFIGLAPLSPEPDLSDVDPRGKAVVNRLSHPFSEIPTLHMVSDLARHKHPDTPILYWHCRGARRKPGDYGYQPARDHTEMMAYFLVERWREAVARIEADADVVGCNIQYEPKGTQRGLHVSGNFWWARAEAIAELQPPDLNAHRNEAEMWIGKLGRDRMFSMHESGVHHYEQTYPREKYVCG